MIAATPCHGDHQIPHNEQCYSIRCHKVHFNKTSMIEVGSIVRAPRPRSTGVDTTGDEGSNKLGKKKQKAVFFTCRATVATIQEEGDDDHNNIDIDHRSDNRQLRTTTTVCLFWEPITPRPFSRTVIDALLRKSSSSKGRQHRQHRVRPFLVTPNLPPDSTTGSKDDVEETTVLLDDVKELLPFEKHYNSNDGDGNCEPAILSVNDLADGDVKNDVLKYKDFGDQLLKLGDASSAIPYYEYALSLSSNVQVGSTIVMQLNGYPRLAEIDCIEEEDDDDHDDGFDYKSQQSLSLDITLVDTEEEMTIETSQVLLCIMDEEVESTGSDTEEKKKELLLQERILLNLSRCLLQLADYDHPEYRMKYLTSAVLSCTLALTVSTYNHTKATKSSSAAATSALPIPPNGQTALLLRAKAQSKRMKYKHAIADAKRLIQLGKQQEAAGSKVLLQQSRKLLKDIEQQQKRQFKTDKSLAKAVCQWVETATTATTTSATGSTSTNAGRNENNMNSSVSRKNFGSGGNNKHGEQMDTTITSDKNNLINTSLSSSPSFLTAGWLFKFIVLPVIITYFIQKYV